MYQESIDIINAEVLERIIETPLDIVGLHEMRPDLGCDEDIFSLHFRIASQPFSERRTDLFFIQVAVLVIIMTLMKKIGTFETHYHAQSRCL